MVRRTEFTDKVDKVIGAKIKELRITSGLSLQDVASKIDVTHQQLQKYENGVNRISAGRLIKLAKVLCKPASFFLDDFDGNYEELPSQHKRMCLEVSRNFMRIKDPHHQNAVSLLVRSLSYN